MVVAALTPVFVILVRLFGHVRMCYNTRMLNFLSLSFVTVACSSVPTSSRLASLARAALACLGGAYTGNPLYIHAYFARTAPDGDQDSPHSTAPPDRAVRDVFRGSGERVHPARALHQSRETGRQILEVPGYAMYTHTQREEPCLAACLQKTTSGVMVWCSAPTH